MTLSEYTFWNPDTIDNSNSDLIQYVVMSLSIDADIIKSSTAPVKQYLLGVLAIEKQSLDYYNNKVEKIDIFAQE